MRQYNYEQLLYLSRKFPQSKWERPWVVRFLRNAVQRSCRDTTHASIWRKSVTRRRKRKCTGTIYEKRWTTTLTRKKNTFHSMHRTAINCTQHNMTLITSHTDLRQIVSHIVKRVGAHVCKRKKETNSVCVYVCNILFQKMSRPGCFGQLSCP